MPTQEQKLKAKDKRLYATYGITLKEWEEMFKKQGECCAVCKGRYPRMCVDHLHQKGFKRMSPEEKRKYIRGICCFLCNTGFKGFEKLVDGKMNRARLEGTYLYFKKYPLKGEI